MTSHEISPLRYPGGKGSLAPFFGRLLAAQPQPCKVFVEPFAGGAGAALRLLLDGHVHEVVLNDLEPGIAALWRSVFGRPEEFARLIETTEVSIDGWHRQREVCARPRGTLDDLELGFATFFVNRTNRSGILGARPIGGLAQAGRWKLDARFNRTTLAARVRRLGRYGERVTVTQRDGVAVAGDYLGPGAFIYADPPYLTQGSGLYLDAMTWDAHRALASALARSQGQWMVTYDHDERVHALYPGFRRAEFALAHTAARPHIGREYAVFGDRVEVASLEGLGRDAVLVP